MGTISDKLNYLIATKDLIKQAIINKGVSVENTDTLRSYAAKIDSIQTGGEQYKILDGKLFFSRNARLTEYLSNKEVFKYMLSDITSAYEMFSECSSNTFNYVEEFKYLGVNLKNIDMTSLFNYCPMNFDILDLTINSTLTNGLFVGCGASVPKIVNSLNLPNSLNIGQLFAYSKFKEVHNLNAPLGTGYQIFYSMRELLWVENINIPKSRIDIFYNCTKLQKINGISFKDYKSIDSKGESLTESTTITTLTEITDLNVSGLVTGGQYLISTYTPNLARLTFVGTSIPNNLTISGTAMVREGIVEMFNSLPVTGTTKNIVLGATKLALLTTEDIAIATGKGYTLS